MWIHVDSGVAADGLTLGKHLGVLVWTLPPPGTLSSGPTPSPLCLWHLAMGQGLILKECGDLQFGVSISQKMFHTECAGRI